MELKFGVPECKALECGALKYGTLESVKKLNIFDQKS